MTGTALDLPVAVAALSTALSGISCLSGMERESSQWLCSSQEEEGWQEENICFQGYLGLG